MAVGRHGAGRDAAHVRVVAPRRHEKHDLALAEHRGDDGDVRQVGTPGKLGVVGGQHISWLQALIPALSFWSPVLDLQLCGSSSALVSGAYQSICFNGEDCETVIACTQLHCLCGTTLLACMLYSGASS